MAEPDRGTGLGADRIAAALAGQKHAPPQRPARFFKLAHVGEREAGFDLRLDDRVAKTPARRDLALPTRAAAEALVQEWNALGEVIDPSRMPLTRIVNAAIDGVAAQAEAVEAEIGNYVGSDLLLYRASEPEPLVAAQARAWDPILEWCRETFGVRFFLAEGLMPVAQPPAALDLMRTAIAASIGEGAGAPFRLAALNVMTTLTGSALLALAVRHGRLTADEAWDAAHVDEAFQEAAWGRDEEALERRGARAREMRAAATLAALV